MIYGDTFKHPRIIDTFIQRFNNEARGLCAGAFCWSDNRIVVIEYKNAEPHFITYEDIKSDIVGWLDKAIFVATYQ